MWIPSVIKKGEGPESHHVYQIHTPNSSALVLQLSVSHPHIIIERWGAHVGISHPKIELINSQVHVENIAKVMAAPPPSQN